VSLIGKLFLLLNYVIGLESHLHKKEFHYCINMIIKSNYHETNTINSNPLYIGASKGWKFKPRRQRFERRWQGWSNQFNWFLEGKTRYSTRRNQFWAQ